MKRREMLALFGPVSAVAMSGTVLLRASTVSAQSPARAFVFAPSDERSRTVEKNLAASLASFEVTVFGRAKDLERSIRQLAPQTVIAPLPTLEELGLRPTLRGIRGGSTTEPYVLVTVDRAFPPRSMSGETVGLLGIMDHGSMREHCAALLGTSDQKIKTVTKYVDLLPLLQFQAAKGVVLPKRFVSLLTSRSELRLVTNELAGGNVGLTSVAVLRRESEPSVVSALKALGSAAKESLGVEGWK